MNHQTEGADKQNFLDLAWQLLLDKGERQHSLCTKLLDNSNEITTSQLGKLFQEADAKTRTFIELYAPLVTNNRAGFVVAHLGQSLDGRIAALNGASRWITGTEDVTHNHRMRALSDAVVVGASTVCYDDPKLTVREIAGPSPVRVVIDPSGRLAADYKVFSDGEAETLILCREDAVEGRERHGKARIIGLSGDQAGLSPEVILDCLRAEGLWKIFIEGGGMTVSRFLEAGCLDRLQITVAPIILGSGRPSVTLPEIDDVADGLRPTIRQFRLGDDMLFECCFDGPA